MKQRKDYMTPEQKLAMGNLPRTHAAEVIPQPLYAAAQPSADPWRNAVDQMLMTSEQTASDDPRESINRLINWHVSVAMDPLVSSDARALIQRGRDEAQPSAEPSLVRAARDAVTAWPDICVATGWVRAMDDAIDALRRALDAGVGVFAKAWAGAARDAARYRWLRDASMTERNRLEHYASDALDAAIDAAMGDALRRALNASDGAGEARPPCGLPGTLRCGLRELAINPPRNPPLWTCDNPNCSRMPRAAVDAPEAKGGGRG